MDRSELVIAAPSSDMHFWNAVDDLDPLPITTLQAEGKDALLEFLATVEVSPLVVVASSRIIELMSCDELHGIREYDGAHIIVFGPFTDREHESRIRFQGVCSVLPPMCSSRILKEQIEQSLRASEYRQSCMPPYMRRGGMKGYKRQAV